MLSRTVVHASLERMNSSILISEVQIPRAESARCADTTRRSLTISRQTWTARLRLRRQTDEPASLREVFEGNPKFRAAWRDAHEYRETFAPPEEATAATVLLGDLNRMDALFFSARAEDHAEFTRTVAQLDPAAFASLAREMANLATRARQRPREEARQRSTARPKQPRLCIPSPVIRTPRRAD